jgi:alkanesulfonate monooxygenase SsuD/methylene tetrahydromethanopterin reductase-like flavin-dependent oxidoreductase (luciferase family)
MRIGLVVGVHGTHAEHPRWADILAQVVAAEKAGFDLVVVEDALFARGQTESVGFWESVSIVAGLAAATERIGIGHSVLNAPYRSPGLTASIATTLDEISGGRYVLGIGMGNTPDDYEPFGIDVDKQFSRFADALPIVTDLLRTGHSDRAGVFHRARGAELVIRGPRPQGPPVIVAAKGPRMLRLAAELGDGWNWWTSSGRDMSDLTQTTTELDQACREVGRDPSTLRRTLDVYSVSPPAPRRPGSEPDRPANVISGSAREIAEVLLGFGTLGFDEARVDLAVQGGPDGRASAIASMAAVVDIVHAER